MDLDFGQIGISIWKLVQKLKITAGFRAIQKSREMSEEGASFKEQILDASRRNNTELLAEILANASPENIPDIINHSKDALGNTPLHLAAKYGSFEVMDTILDQEGTEVDPVNVIDGDTPLHLAVRYSETEPEHGHFIAETLVEAGADAR